MLEQKTEEEKGGILKYPPLLFLPMSSLILTETVPQLFSVGSPTLSLPAITESVGAISNGFLTSGPLTTEQRMLEFMMPILNPEKPKRITLTMANTLFGALSEVRPINWVLIIHEIVTRGISQIDRKPPYISPFIMHLYACHGCTTVDEDDMLISAQEEITYKLQPVAYDTSTESDHPIPEAPPSGEPALCLRPLHTILLH